VITHGHTLTSKILFEDVIQAIKDYGFRTSPYPVVLSLENHCSKKQQDRMAAIMEKVLGEKLFVLPANYEDFTMTLSPDDLKYKVLLKGKGSFKNAVELLKKSKKAKPLEMSEEYAQMKSNNFLHKPSDQVSGTGFADIKENELTEHGIPTKVPTPVARNINFFSAKTNPNREPEKPAKQTANAVRLQERENAEEVADSVVSDDDEEEKMEEGLVEGKTQEVQNDKKASGKKPAAHSAANSLVQIISLFSKRYTPGDTSLGTWHISSVAERKLVKLLKKDLEQDLTEFTKRNFLKLYPLGIRFDSSNMDTVPGFYIGAQVIAMNYQKADIHLLIYLSKFIQNGGLKSGYVLKPDFMLYNSHKPIYASNFKEVTFKITIKIISAQQLKVITRSNSGKNKDIVDPFISVSLKGIQADEDNNPAFKTAIIQDNGFNPQYDETITLNIRAPELAFLVFQAWDKDNLNDERLGWYSIPVSCLRKGYRVIPMRGDSLEIIDNSFIFCHFTIERIGGR
jgi:phosphatidylinositol phospholipase C, delta